MPGLPDAEVDRLIDNRKSVGVSRLKTYLDADVDIDLDCLDAHDVEEVQKDIDEVKKSKAAGNGGASRPLPKSKPAPKRLKPLPRETLGAPWTVEGLKH